MNLTLRRCPVCEGRAAYRLFSWLPDGLRDRLVITIRREGPGTPFDRRKPLRYQLRPPGSATFTHVCVWCCNRRQVPCETISPDENVEGRLVIANDDDTIMRVHLQRGDWQATLIYFYAEQMPLRVSMRDLVDGFLLVPLPLASALEAERSIRRQAPIAGRPS